MFYSLNYESNQLEPINQCKIRYFFHEYLLIMTLQDVHTEERSIPSYRPFLRLTDVTSVAVSTERSRVQRQNAVRCVMSRSKKNPCKKKKSEFSFKIVSETSSATTWKQSHNLNLKKIDLLQTFEN